MKKILYFCFLVFATSCATRQDPAGLELIPEPEFLATYNSNTKRVQKYDGLYNTIDATVTIRNSQVLRAQLDQNARLYQWDRSQYQLESNKVADKAKNETEVFVSFFTPDRKNDDLNKKTTQWKVYLDVDGKRWEGKISKFKGQTSEIRGVFPSHSQFGTPYSVTFPLPTKSVDNASSKLMITGPLGIAEFVF
jgi:hypothetical protein